MDLTVADYRGTLSGIRVIDLTRVVAGPYATTLLADLGADVIKVEDVGSGDSSRLTPPFINGVSNHFMNINRNKRSVAIDLKHPDGRRLVLKLVSKADVVIANFRPGVLERLGLDYESLKSANPKIILCLISGFGQDSTYRDKPSFDVITQAMSGAMSITGEPGRPPVRLGVPMGDLAGGLFGAIAILAALNERNATGHGQSIDVSMLDAMVHLMLYYPIDYLNAGLKAIAVGGRHEHVAPYGVFAVQDGYIVLAIFQGKFWRLYCEAIGHPELIRDRRFVDTKGRHANRAELYATLEPIMLQRTRHDWEEALDQKGIPWAPILKPDEVAEHPLMREREMFVNVNHPEAGWVKVSGRPIKFPQRHQPSTAPAPMHGQHTGEVLLDLAGLTSQQLIDLEQQGTIKQSTTNIDDGNVLGVTSPKPGLAEPTG